MNLVNCKWLMIRGSPLSWDYLNASDRSLPQIGLSVKELTTYRKSSAGNKVSGLRQDHTRSSCQAVGSRSLSVYLLVLLSLLQQASLLLQVALLAQPEPYPLRTIRGVSSSLSAKMEPLLESSLLALIGSFAPDRLFCLSLWPDSCRALLSQPEF